MNDLKSIRPTRKAMEKFNVLKIIPQANFVKKSFVKRFLIKFTKYTVGQIIITKFWFVFKISRFSVNTFNR